MEYLIFDTSVSQAFAGIAAIIIAIVIAYLLYHITRFYKVFADKEEIYTLVEVGQLYKIAENKNIDIDILREKLSMIKHNKFNFRTKLEKEVYNRMFEEKKE